MRRGLLDALPFSIYIFVTGMIFGAGAGPAGMTNLTAVLMSLFVFSGSAQFAALGLWGHGMGTIIVTTGLLSSRFLLMSASLSARLPPLKGWQRALLGYAVSDEAYALFTGQGATGGTAYITGAALMLYLPWLVGTLVGVAVGPVIPPGWQQPLTSLFPMVFVILTVLTAGTRPKALVALTGATLGIAGALFLPAGLHVPAAGILAAVLGPALEQKATAKAVQA